MKLQILIPTILLFSCSKHQTEDKKVFDVGSIYFEYPSTWHLIPEKGIDSYFSNLTNGIDTISIEYGDYNPKIYKEPLKDHLFTQITIDNTTMVIERPKDDYGYTNLYIPRTDSISGLFMHSNKTKNNNDILNIYSSLRIGKSKRKTSIALPKSRFTDKNNPTAIMIYENSCMNCHSEYRVLIGPPLYPKIYNQKGRKWFEKYFYSEKKNINPEINVKCDQFQKKDSAVVHQLLDYLFTL